MFTENLDTFLDQDELALAATYNGATAASVLFDAAYADPLGMAATGPVARGKASVFPEGDGAGGCIGKTLLVSGVTYTIRTREPVDDGAFVLLRLSAP